LCCCVYAHFYMKNQLTANTLGHLKAATPEQSQYSGDRRKMSAELISVRGYEHGKIQS
jgi:hypothetical protein